MDTLRDIFMAMGIPRQHITIAWQDLTCNVPVLPPSEAIQTVVSAFTGGRSLLKNGGAKLKPSLDDSTSTAAKDDPTPERADVLSHASGYVEPGTMCLVLGPSGCGSSLLLKRLAGRPIGSTVELGGKVLFNGQEKLNGFLHPSHFAQYVAQYDEHLAHLTVRQTLEFAAACKWPTWVPHVEAIRKNDVLLTARMLKIERTLDTIIGNETLRGVSGGERKRVTIGEMLVGMNAGCVVMDNWSKGLDSSTTLSITRSMREIADISNVPVITSMQAPGADAFKLFDTLCVMEQGHIIYFGPRDQAESWFLGLGFHRPPQRSVPDFIATVANPALRAEYLHVDLDINALEDVPPTTPEEFADRFERSELSAMLGQKVMEASARKPLPEPNIEMPHSLWQVGQKATLNKPRHQIKAIGRRQLQFIGATKDALLADLAQNLILGVMLGSIFWQLDKDAAGATTRGGLLFLALLFMSLASLAKLPEKHDDRKVFAKQRYSSFYSAWPAILTYTFFDVVIEIARSSCFLIPLYLMAGMSLGGSAQRLLYAVLIVSVVSLIMIALTRFLVAVFDDSESAQGVGGILTIILILFTGFMKPPQLIDEWIKWLYWINPLHYAFEALLLNEFDGLTFKCDPEELLPPHPAVPMDLRVCTVGDGLEFIEQMLGVTNGPIFRLYFFLVSLGFLVVFVLVAAVATALSKPSGHALKLRSKADMNRRTELESVSHSVSIDVRGAKMKTNTRFTFKDVVYAVADGKKRLLNEISGHAIGGKVVLLMGESGAGKSTLLDVCSLRKTMGKGTTMDGDIRINGVPISKEKIAHWTGYCEQNDMHIGEATVKEAVCFSANLRLPKVIRKREKNVRAMETIDLLGLTPFADILVKSLGAGELKLLTMALEVVADPIVLFLDEPTSGISASSALVVANALRKIADTGTSVICTVHQPSTEVFAMFDQLLLLKRGGKQVYFGDIGEGGGAIRNYFRSRGAPEMEEDTNPADWMLDVIADESKDWSGEWRDSEERRKTVDEVEELAKPEDDVDSSEGSFQGIGLQKQLFEVVRRLFWRYWRLPEYNLTRVVLMLAIALLIGVLYLRDVEDTQVGAQVAFAALFLTVIPSSLSAQNVIPPTVNGRSVFYREIASGTYKPLSFHFALGLVEIPFTFVATLVFTIVFYFMVGLDAARFGYFFLAAQLLYYFSVVLGVMLASITPSIALAEMIASSFTSVFNVLSGFFITKNAMPVWWRWSTWINPFFYYLSGIVQNQMNDRDFTCKPTELLEFGLPEGFATCEEIPDSNFGTVIRNGISTCTFCPIPNGQVLIERFSADDVNKWVGLVAIGVSIMVCRVVAGYAFARIRFLSR
ncbi:unnamed protein product [Chondrus crispus]|uniref:Probable ATP-dependent transporter ycf16 n=1 Tax=Chondrus crispus TaxID=2769 RepID=R7Q8Z8_CHOCR|nr:unnamed protein product [Chondrus crispus]CDF34514.1 unnamed protein product [Chondrus crispus]|eukprot:XP_005714333.1 unnamed protein product [Chondrus crispus]